MKGFCKIRCFMSLAYIAIADLPRVRVSTTVITTPQHIHSERVGAVVEGSSIVKP